MLRDSLTVVELHTGKKASKAGLGLDAQPVAVPEELRSRPCLSLEQTEPLLERLAAAQRARG